MSKEQPISSTVFTDDPEFSEISEFTEFSEIPEIPEDPEEQKTKEQSTQTTIDDGWSPDPDESKPVLEVYYQYMRHRSAEEKKWETRPTEPVISSCDTELGPFDLLHPLQPLPDVKLNMRQMFELEMEKERTAQKKEETARLKAEQRTLELNVELKKLQKDVRCLQERSRTFQKI